MRILGLIPARGGSKGIPKKNLAPLGGKPLIQYTVEAALASSRLDEVLLSCDDEEIIDVCESLGLRVPFRRPASLASDDAKMIDVVLHTLDWLEQSMRELPDAVMLLQPTCPLRSARDIDEAATRFEREEADSLVSVHIMHEHPYECVHAKDDSWSFLAKPVEGIPHNRHTYDQRYYFINGAIYLVRTDVLRHQRFLFMEGESLLYEMPPARGVDVDTKEDLRYAEFLRSRSGGVG